MNAPHLIRLTGVEHLRSWLAERAAAPDLLRQPDLACRHCGAVLTVRTVHRRTGTRTIIYHPLSVCAQADSIRHFAGLDRAAAIAAFEESEA